MLNAANLLENDNANCVLQLRLTINNLTLLNINK